MIETNKGYLLRRDRSCDCAARTTREDAWVTGDATKGLEGTDDGAGQGATAASSPACPDAFVARLKVLNRSPYLLLADEGLQLISVFDDLKYDRADMDMMSGPMRRLVVSKLEPLGFRQVSGTVLEHAAEDVRMHFPKFRALGASPFDAIRDTPRRPQDYFILTPTQTACQLIAHHPKDVAVSAIKTLIEKHPVNLMRIFDFLDDSEAHRDFAEAIGYLKFVQRKAVSTEPLQHRRALR